MLDPAHPFTDEDIAFIRSRGTLYGSGDTWKAKADAAAEFADGWSIVANMLHMKGVSEYPSGDGRLAALSCGRFA